MPGHSGGQRLPEVGCRGRWRLPRGSGHGPSHLPSRSSATGGHWGSPSPRHRVPPWGLGMVQGWAETLAHGWGSRSTSAEDMACHGHCCAASAAELRRGTSREAPA